MWSRLCTDPCMKSYFFLLLICFSLHARALTGDCLGQEHDGEYSDLLAVVQENNRQNSKPLNLDVSFLGKEITTDKSLDSINYSTTDLALDAGITGIVLSSQGHLPDDKFKHVAAGALISYGATNIARIYFKNDEKAKIKSILAGIGAATLIGILKELVDKNGSGTYDKKDAYYTILGGTLVSIRYTAKF